MLVHQLPALPSAGWAWLLILLVIAAWRWPRYALPALFLLTGLLWTSFRAGLILAETLATDLEGADLQVEGRIADLPVPTERGRHFVFDIERAWHDGRPVAVPRRVQLNLYDEAAVLRVGDAWAFTVRLKRPHGFYNPGGFDYEAYLLQQRIRATGYVREASPGRRLTIADEPPPWAYRLNRFRQDLGAALAHQLAGHAFTGMIVAFANGDDDAIPDTQWDVLNRTGTTHLIAISGMNIGLVAGLAFYLMRRLWALPGLTVLWLPAPRVAAVTALAAATAYAALAGFAIPTQRALVMLAVALGGVLLGRNTAPSVLLAVALLAVLCLDPLSLLAPGFWLSFGAVAVILYAVAGDPATGWRERLRAWGRVQWAIAIGLLPLLLLLFQQASLSAPLANLVAIPVVETVVIPATLTGVAASLLLPDPVAAAVLGVAGHALEWLWPLLEWLARFEAAQWQQPAPPLWAIPAALVGFALLLAPRGFPARWLGAFWLLPVFVVRPAVPAPGELWFTLLDVGQGLSGVVRTAGHTLVYDTGARLSSRFDLGRAVLVPFLRHAGVDRVDTLIVSHADNDHIGGSRSLLAALPVHRVLTSVPERFASASPCQAGQQWEWDGVRFELLHPEADTPLTGNNRSCVLHVTSRHGRLLLPGDIAARAERALLLEHETQLAADVLVVPHHGSRSSSTETFLDTVQPRLALLPVGYRNRYRHPDPGVVARYRERGIALADSPDGGAITVRFTAQGMTAIRYRDSQRRYWHGQ